eukprot:scaffold250769_cov20-Prasinocladus_malaysianus.AAC.1
MRFLSRSEQLLTALTSATKTIDESARRDSVQRKFASLSEAGGRRDGGNAGALARLAKPERRHAGPGCRGGR